MVQGLREQGLTVRGTADLDAAVTALAAGDIDAVAIGAGLDDAVRLPFAARLRGRLPGIEVHVKPDRSGGPAAMVPFVKGVAGRAVG